MGFRFRRSIRLAPGLRLNLSKRGSSLSVGRPGATANFGRGRTQTSLGLPGTGISCRSTSEGNGRKGGVASAFIGCLVIAFFVYVAARALWIWLFG